MKQKLASYYETELTYIKVGLIHNTDPESRSNACRYAKHRALGAGQMAQMCGLSFEEAETMYLKFCEDIDIMRGEIENAENDL